MAGAKSARNTDEQSTTEAGATMATKEEEVAQPGREAPRQIPPKSDGKFSGDTGNLKTPERGLSSARGGDGGVRGPSLAGWGRGGKRGKWEGSADSYSSGSELSVLKARREKQQREEAEPAPQGAEVRELFPTGREMDTVVVCTDADGQNFNANLKLVARRWTRRRRLGRVRHGRRGEEMMLLSTGPGSMRIS